MISRSGWQILQLLICSLLAHISVQAHDWKHSGAIYILTTPEGANLPTGAVEQDFPLLVRIDKDFFDFSEAQPQGQDIRFTSGSGQPFSYQIEQWDPVGGKASIWVRIPEIRGNSQQDITMKWGNREAQSASDSQAVFSKSNGYLTVLHTGAYGQEVYLSDEFATLAADERISVDWDGAETFDSYDQFGLAICSTESPTGRFDLVTFVWYPFGHAQAKR